MSREQICPPRMRGDRRLPDQTALAANPLQFVDETGPQPIASQQLSESRAPLPDRPTNVPLALFAIRCCSQRFSDFDQMIQLAVSGNQNAIRLDFLNSIPTW